MTISKKQEPVVDRMVLLLEQSKSVSAAIADNAMDSSDPLDSETIMLFARQLNSIKQFLHSAYEA